MITSPHNREYINYADICSNKYNIYTYKKRDYEKIAINFSEPVFCNNTDVVV